MAEDLDIDQNDQNEMDDLDFDFDFDLNPEVDAEDREPLEDVKAGALNSLNNPALHTTMRNALLNNALPTGYTEAINAAGDAHNSITDLYDKAAGDLKQPIRTVKKSIHKRADKLRSFLPDSWVDKIKEATKVDEIKESSGVDYNALEIKTSLADIFEKEQQLDAVKESLRQEREERYREIDFKAQDFGNRRLAEISQFLGRMQGYQDTVLVDYQRKTLETQMRQFFVSKELLTTLKAASTDQDTRLKAIQKNTALPDWLKSRLSEDLKQISTERLLGQVDEYVEDATGPFFDQLFENLGEKLGEMTGSISMMTDQLEMADEMSEGMEGFGPSNLEIASGMVTDELAEGGAGALGGMLGRFLKNNEDVVRVGNELQYMMQNAPFLINDYVEELGGLSPVGRFLEDIMPKVGTEGISLNTDQAALVMRGQIREAAFDEPAHLSLVDIIPGHLSKMSNYLEMIATGNADAEREVFDFETRSMVRESEAKELFKQRFEKETGHSSRQYSSENILARLDPTGKATQEEATELLRIMLDNISEGRAFSFDSLEESGRLPEVFNDRLDEIRSMSKAEQSKLKLETSKDYVDLARGEKAAAEFISKQLAQGNQTIIDEFGLLEQRRGKLGINQDSVHDMMTYRDTGDRDNYRVKHELDGYDDLESTDEQVGIVKNRLNEAYESTRSAAIGAVDSVKDFLNRPTSDIKDQLADEVSGYYRAAAESEVVKKASDSLESVRESRAGQTVTETMQRATDNVRGAFNGASETVHDVTESISNAEIVRSLRGMLNKTDRQDSVGPAAPASQDSRDAVLEFVTTKRLAMSNDPDGDDPSMQELDSLARMAAKPSTSQRKLDTSVRSYVQRNYGSTTVTPTNITAGFGLDGLTLPNQESPEKASEPFTLGGMGKPIPVELVGGETEAQPYSGYEQEMLELVKHGFGNLIEQAGQIAINTSSLEGIELDQTKSMITRAGEFSKNFLSGLGTGLKSYSEGVGSAFRSFGAGGRDLFAGIGEGIGGVFRRQGADAMDVFVKGEDEPRLKARALRKGEYVDKASGKQMYTIDDLRNAEGPIIDADGNEVLNAEDIEKGIYHISGSRLVSMANIALKPVNGILNFNSRVFDTLMSLPGKAFNTLKNINVRVHDVYVAGEDSPRLLAVIFRNGGYFSAGTGAPISDPSKIDGPVMNRDGEVILSQEDITKGIFDKDGNSIGDGLIKHLAKKALNVASSFTSGVFEMNKRIVNSGADLMGAAANKMKGGLKNRVNISTKDANVEVVGKLDEILLFMKWRWGNGEEFNPFAQPESVPMAGDEVDSAPFEELLDKQDEIIQSLEASKPKSVAGDRDGDGDRDNGIRDILQRRKEAKEKESLLPKSSAKSEEEKEKSGILGTLMMALAPLAGSITSLVSTMSSMFLGGKALDAAGDIFGGGGDFGPDGKRTNKPGKAPGKMGRFLKGAKHVGGKALSYGAKALPLLVTGGKLIGGLALRAAAGAAAVAGGIISAPVAAAIGIGATALTAYSYFSKRVDPEPIEKLRFLQYGLPDDSGTVMAAIRDLEDDMLDYVEWQDGKPVYTEDVVFAVEEWAESHFDVNMESRDEQMQWATWFAKRFVPVFFTHLTAIRSLDPDVDLLDIDDEIRDEHVEAFVRKVTDNPFKDADPYSINGFSLGGIFIKANTAEISSQAASLLKTKSKEKEKATAVTVPVVDDKNNVQVKPATPQQKQTIVNKLASKSPHAAKVATKLTIPNKPLAKGKYVKPVHGYTEPVETSNGIWYGSDSDEVVAPNAGVVKLVDIENGVIVIEGEGGRSEIRNMDSVKTSIKVGGRIRYGAELGKSAMNDEMSSNGVYWKVTENQKQTMPLKPIQPPVTREERTRVQVITPLLDEQPVIDKATGKPAVDNTPSVSSEPKVSKAPVQTYQQATMSTSKDIERFVEKDEHNAKMASLVTQQSQNQNMYYAKSISQRDEMLGLLKELAGDMLGVREALEKEEETQSISSVPTQKKQPAKEKPAKKQSQNFVMPKASNMPLDLSKAVF